MLEHATDGAGIQANEPAQQLLGEGEAGEDQRDQERVGQRHKRVLAALANGPQPRAGEGERRVRSACAHRGVRRSGNIWNWAGVTPVLR